MAARGGKWKPDFALVSWVLTPWALEMLLALPSPWFQLLALLLSLPAPALPAPGLEDLVEGRKTMTSAHLDELVQVCAGVVYS